MPLLQFLPPCSSSPPRCLFPRLCSLSSSSFATRRRQLRAMASPVVSVSSVAREWHHTTNSSPKTTQTPPSGITVKMTSPRRTRARTAMVLNDPGLEVRARLFSLFPTTSSMPRFKAASSPLCDRRRKEAERVRQAERGEGEGHTGWWVLRTWWRHVVTGTTAYLRHVLSSVRWEAREAMKRDWRSLCVRTLHPVFRPSAINLANHHFHCMQLSHANWTANGACSTIMLWA